MKKLPTVSEIQMMAVDVLERLRSGKVSVEQAQAEIRAVNSMQTGLALRMEWAQRAGLVAQGSDVVPDVQQDPHATPSPPALTSRAARMVIAAKSAKNGSRAKS